MNPPFSLLGKLYRQHKRMMGHVCWFKSMCSHILTFVLFTKTKTGRTPLCEIVVFHLTDVSECQITFKSNDRDCPPCPPPLRQQLCSDHIFLSGNLQPVCSVIVPKNFFTIFYISFTIISARSPNALFKNFCINSFYFFVMKPQN